MLRVTAAVLVNKGRILIAQKGPNDKRANKWEFPGGKIDAGETPEECVVREMKEEFLIDIQVSGLFTESIFTYPEGELLIFAYYCSWIGGELTLTEHADYRWVKAQELSNFDFVPSDLAIAKKLIKCFKEK